MNSYRTITKLPDETNWQFCQRVAAAVPSDEMTKGLLEWILAQPWFKRKKLPLWSIVGQVTSSGSGVSSAIVQRFLGRDPDGP